MATQAQLAAVQQLYVGYLGRAADAEGQKFWADAIANGTATIASVATGFTLSAEYQAAYAGLDSAALVDKIYTNVLGRAADAEGKAFWVAALANGTVAADTLLATMITNLGALDQQTINNKVFVAQTYTDTVGADYNPEAGASVISGVTNDPATVTEALNQISSGTLNGQVVGLELIKALNAAEAAEDTFETANQSAVDALVKKLSATDGATFADDLVSATDAARSARFDATSGVSTKSTAVLTAEVQDATSKLATAKAAVVAIDGGAAAITAYDKAVAADTAADAAVAANAAATAAAVAGLDTAIGATGSAVTLATLSTAAGVTTDFANAQEVLDFLSDSTQTAAARTKLVTELNKVATYGAELVKAGDLGLAAEKSQDALDDATLDLQSITTGSEGQDYIDAEEDLADANELLADAKAADADIAAVKAIADGYKILTDKTKAAEEAIFKAVTGFNDTHTDAQIVTLNADKAGVDTVKETFFFADKAVAANDFSITKFGAGDSIVLGSDYTFNKGALSTGDNNKAEFFLVQKDSDTLVILETEKYGSSTVAKAADGSVDNSAVHAADNVAVITLSGVNVADLTVNNGVISHVA